jgi:hypothetical protein
MVLYARPEHNRALLDITVETPNHGRQGF